MAWLKSKSLTQSSQPVVKVWILALLYKVIHIFIEIFAGLKGWLIHYNLW